jgi:hypothetical protein
VAHTRSEATCTTPPLQERLAERDRKLDGDAQRLLNRARAYFIRLRRTPFPREALEAE